MNHREEFIAGRLKWKINKSGLFNSNAHLYDEMTSAEKMNLEKIFNSSDIGKPVVIFQSENGFSTIFGTSKIISIDQLDTFSVDYASIDKHSVGDDPFNIFSKDQNKQEFSKTTQTKLLIQDKKGELRTFHAANSKELYAMYNILLMMTKLNR